MDYGGALSAVGRELLFVTNPVVVNGSVLVPEDQCYCAGWIESRGTNGAQTASNVLQWLAAGFSILLLMFYAYQTWKSTCGWEEIYVCAIEMVKVILEFFFEFKNPSMLYLATGHRVQWLRYAEWLLTCPVILIRLSNLTGLSNDYSRRTMGLLVSDIGTIVWGATSAMATGYVKVIFFCLGLCYGANTFFHAAKAYIEGYHTVPKGRCRQVVTGMAWLFFVSWGMFPILFILGPEGFGVLSVYGSTVGHTIIDLMSKNCWGLLGHYLRVLIHEHILIHGDIRKTTKLNIGGTEIEVETLVEDEAEAGAVPAAAVSKGEEVIKEFMRFKVRMEGSMNGHEFEIEGEGEGRPYEGTQTAKLKVTKGGPLPFAWDILSPQFMYGSKAYVKHPADIPDYKKLSFPEGFKWERVMNFEDGGLVTVTQDSSLQDGTLIYKVKMRGTNFPPDGPVMQKKTMGWEASTERLYPRDGVLKGEIHQALKLKDGGHYLVEFKTIYMAKKPVQLPGYYYVDTKLDITSHNEDYTIVEQYERSEGRHHLFLYGMDELYK